MRSFLSARALCAGLAAVLMASVTSSAFAVQVQYTTVGKFTATGTAVSSGGGLTFFGATGTVDEPTFISLGSFTASGLPETFSNAGFQIDIIQTQPDGGQGTLLGSLTGKLNTTSSQTQLTFTNNSTIIVGDEGIRTMYTALGPVAIAPSTSDFGFGLGKTTIQGEVAVVPLPAAVWGGMALMGVLGVKKLRSLGPLEV